MTVILTDIGKEYLANGQTSNLIVKKFSLMDNVDYNVIVLDDAENIHMRGILGEAVQTINIKDINNKIDV